MCIRDRDTTKEHIQISGSGLEFKSGSVAKFQVHRGGVQIGSSDSGVSFDLNGNATFNGSIAIGSMNGAASGSSQLPEIATAQSSSDSATTTGEQGISDAATAQSAVDTLETQLVLTSDGVKLLNNSNVAVANFGTTLVLGTTGSNEENVLIDSDSVDVRSGTDVLSSFGSTTTIGSTSTEHLKLSLIHI